jgi:hypothetical protein
MVIGPPQKPHAIFGNISAPSCDLATVIERLDLPHTCRSQSPSGSAQLGGELPFQIYPARELLVL